MTRIVMTLWMTTALGCLDTRPVDLGAQDGDATSGDSASEDGSAADAAVDATVEPQETSTPEEEVTAADCLSASPTVLDFGSVAIGQVAVAQATIMNCGTTGAVITSFALSADTNSVFEVVDPGIVLPHTLGPGETLLVSVRAGDLSPGPGGAVTVSQGAVVVRTTTGELRVALSARSTGLDCPTAVIGVLEGGDVLPQTLLHLSGTGSYSPRGEIVGWQWEVDQPVGSGSVFLPSPYVRQPYFEANVAGVYTFRLTVHDETGEASCVAAERQVFVSSDRALHVELLWTTPSDIDLSDATGADLDLHFVHPLAAAPGYFDLSFDCFWSNEAPNWGNIDPAADDNPSLDLDDTDGAGPENLNFAHPEEGRRYCLAAHYWDDKELGTSYATVRIYQHGQLTYERSGVAMVAKDLWEVACIEWPGGVIESLETEAGPKITHDYTDPDFLQP